MKSILKSTYDTLHFLRHYPTEYEAAFYWQVDFKTWRKYVFSTAIKLAQNLHEVPKDILISVH